MLCFPINPQGMVNSAMEATKPKENPKFFIRKNFQSFFLPNKKQKNPFSNLLFQENSEQNKTFIKTSLNSIKLHTSKQTNVIH
jgi:hypothetical protein